MSYSIGQFRRTQLADSAYKSAIDYEKTTVTTDSFSDVAVTASLSSDSSYYLSFRVTKRSDSVQDFTLKLQSSTQTQTIDTFSCPKGSGNAEYEIIITPNGTYDELVFELERIVTDYSNPREMKITITNFFLINNIISSLDTTEIKKIGIQGNPGQLMCINGEQIRIGKSGVYELDNGYTVTSIGFVIKASSIAVDGLDYFIIDYQY